MLHNARLLWVLAQAVLVESAHGDFELKHPPIYLPFHWALRLLTPVTHSKFHPASTTTAEIGNSGRSGRVPGFWSGSGNTRCRYRVVKRPRALSGDGWGVRAGCLASFWAVLVDFLGVLKILVVLVEFRRSGRVLVTHGVGTGC